MMQEINKIKKYSHCALIIKKKKITEFKYLRTQHIFYHILFELNIELITCEKNITLTIRIANEIFYSVI